MKIAFLSTVFGLLSLNAFAAIEVKDAAYLQKTKSMVEIAMRNLITSKSLPEGTFEVSIADDFVTETSGLKLVELNVQYTPSSSKGLHDCGASVLVTENKTRGPAFWLRVGISCQDKFNEEKDVGDSWAFIFNRQGKLQGKQTTF